jgi:bacterioferritin (cytochrome b1)
MLLSRDEMRFDFGGATLDPKRDREILGFVFNQFLYGEVTGIQVGHWIHAAPDLEAARFLAKQAVEELQHVGNFLRVMQMLDIEPAPAHPILRFLATGMMGDDWAEHVALEMATGEGFVLTAFYAVIDTLDAPEAVAILERAARQEEGHVDFGEQRTMALLEREPGLRRKLLGANLVWMWAVGRLAKHIDKHLPRAHPVLGQLDAFLKHALACAELRLQRLGLIDRPLSALSATHKAGLVAELLATKGGAALVGALRAPLEPLGLRRQRLTDRYLNDPAVRDRPSPHHAAGKN